MRDVKYVSAKFDLISIAEQTMPNTKPVIKILNLGRLYFIISIKCARYSL